MYENLKKRLVREEGKKLKKYRCTAGHWTIGIGHNLDSEPYFHGAKIPAVITDEECDAIFVHDVAEAEKGLQRTWPEFRKIEGVRRDALIEMSFQLGSSGVMNFHDMINAVNHGDWTKAYQEALDSKWATIETPERARRVVSQFLTNRYCKE